MRIAIDCGHNPPGDLGSTSSEYKLAEFVEAHRIVSYVYRELYEKGFQIVNFAERLKTKVQIVNKSKPDIAIEVHLNSCSDVKQRGALCMYYPSQKSRDLARFILKEIGNVSAVGIIGSALIKKRGVYVGNFRLDPSYPILYFLRKTKCPAVVVEPLFLSNTEDCKLLKRGQIHKIIAEGIYLGILDYMRLYK